MDKVYDIRELAKSGYSTRQIAAEVGCNRETVMKYIKTPITVPSPFKRCRQTEITPFVPYVENLLKSERALSNHKHKLTAKRIHSLIIEGKLTEELPATQISQRTVERLVQRLRQTVLRSSNHKHLKLQHAPGKAQVDFGEIEMLEEGGERRHFILVMSFPFSNFRLAHVLPAQNFECLAHGLIEMFNRIGRVPTVLRCDNMSTAVSKIIRREDVAESRCNHGALDHPRRLTDNFMALKLTYGFDAEFCNPASGNEKGSVENAVGWVRRNFFSPLRQFNGDYTALNEELTLFCIQEAEKQHYRHKPQCIKDLFKEDLAAMAELPEQPFEAHSWSEATITKDCRALFETNGYQIDLPPGTKVLIKRRWNQLVFYNERGEVVAEHPRSYGNRKDNIDWVVELSMLSERPSAFNSSYLRKVLTDATRSYMDRLKAPQRAILLKALAQRLGTEGGIAEEVTKLDGAVRRYGDMTVESVVAGCRGANDVATDGIRPMTNLPAGLGDMSLPSRDVWAVLDSLTGEGHA